MNAKQLKYGHTRGGSVSVPCAVAAETYYAASGRFVYMNAGVATLAAAGANELFGFADCAAGLKVAGEVVNVIVDPSAVFRIPVITGTFVVAMIGDTCDIGVSAGIQGADLTASTDDVLIIVGGDAVDNLWVDVMLSQNERAQTGAEA
jgi:hypothetical protein